MSEQADLIYQAISDVGRSRGHNEDSFLADSENGLWIVADGMGGHEGGEIASALAVEHIHQMVLEGHALVDAIMLAHEAIQNAVERGEGKKGMGCTVVALRMDNQNYEIAWVGDSRAYLWNGQLRQLTRDHTFVQKLLDAGAIDEDEANEHPEKSVIAQALGADVVNVEPEVVKGKLYRGEYILLCSDGLSGEVPDEQILNLFSNSKGVDEMAGELIRAALENGGSDNVTVVLVQASDECSEKPTLAATVPFDSRELDRQLELSKSVKSGRMQFAAGMAVALIVSVFVWLFSGDDNDQAVVDMPTIGGGSGETVPSQIYPAPEPASAGDATQSEANPQIPDPADASIAADSGSWNQPASVGADQQQMQATDVPAASNETGISQKTDAAIENQLSGAVHQDQGLAEAVQNQTGSESHLSIEEIIQKETATNTAPLEENQ